MLCLLCNVDGEKPRRPREARSLPRQAFFVPPDILILVERPSADVEAADLMQVRQCRLLAEKRDIPRCLYPAG